MRFKSVFIVVTFVLLRTSLFPQSSLVLDSDPYIVISNGAYLVIDNSTSSGIVQTGTGGRIISEAETNRVRWNVSNGTGTYVVPFYEDGEALEIPVTVQITAAGTAGATNHIDFSTYDGGSDNFTYMPSGVTNMGNVTVPAANNSLQATDRFWVLDANHATKPDVTLTFTYIDAENAAPNTLAEANLGAQRWNATISDWDNFSFPPTGTVATGANTVSSVVVASADFFKAWTLVDNTTPLPIELLQQSAKCDGSNSVIKWSTLSETNNDYFTIEHSVNGINFETAGIVDGSGTSTTLKNYLFTEPTIRDGIMYYRIKQTDFDNHAKYFPIMSLNCKPALGELIIYPNPNAGSFQIIGIEIGTPIQIFSANGQLVLQTTSTELSPKINITNLSSGIYFLKTSINGEIVSKKIALSNSFIVH